MTYLEYKIGNPLNKVYLMGFLVLLLFIVPTGLLGQKSAQLIQSSKTHSAKHSSNASAMLPVIGSIDEYIESHNEPPYEKIFLHSDRHTYLQSDTIWFKA
jgi:cytochrome b